MAKKISGEAKKEIAFSLYMNFETQQEIAEKVGVSRQTIGKWIDDNRWADRRAAKTISRPELSNRILKLIADDLEKLNDNSDEGINSSMVDRLTKLASLVEKLDKKAGVVETIEVFIAFGKWLQYQTTIDPELDAEFVKRVNEYQNRYINELMNNKNASK